MTYVSRILVLLIVGLFMMSASASADDRLTVSGFIDTRIVVTDNYSRWDYNYTKLPTGIMGVKGDLPANITGQAGDEDGLSFAMTRFNLRFTIEAFENSKAVLQTHTDKEWGSSGVLFNDGEYIHGASVNAYGGAPTIEGYWFESLIPGTAATFQIGVPYFAAESGGFGEATKLFNTAAPGITLSAPLSDTISTYTWYAWLGQDFDGYNRGHASGRSANVRLIDTDGDGVNDAGKVKEDIGPNGNDWAFGTRVTFTLVEGLSADLLYAYHLSDAGGAMGAEEDRHWVGGTARYQYGDFSFLPSLILYLADADAGDTESFILDVRAKYVTGPLSLEGRLVYTPGDSNGNDRSYDVIGNWAVPGAVEGFALFGNSYGRTDLGPLSFGHTIQQNIRYDTYGLMHAMAKADYTLTPQTTLSVALGLFNAAEETSGIADGIPDAGTDLRNITYAGGSHIATEIDAWLKYQLYSNAHVLFWAAYAMTGDALDLMMDEKTYESQDVLGAGAQIAYTF